MFPDLNASFLQNIVQTNLLWSIGIFSVLAAVKLLRIQNAKTIYHLVWLSYCLLLPATFSRYFIGNQLNVGLSGSVLAVPARQVALQVAAVSQRFSGTEIWGRLLLAGVALSLIYFIVKLVVLYLRRTKLRPCENPLVSRLLKELQAELGLTKEITCLISSDGISPYSMGVFKPVIVLPAQILTSAPQRSLKIVLSHELIHIKSNDYLKNILQKLVRTVVFFNPFVMFFDAYIDRVREMACDRDVLSLLPIKRGEYANTILDLNLVATRKLTHSAVIPFSQNKSNLKRRIMKMKVSNKRDTLAKNVLVGLVVLIFVVVLSCTNDNTISSTDQSAKISETTKEMAKLELILAAEAVHKLPADIRKAMELKSAEKLHLIREYKEGAKAVSFHSKDDATKEAIQRHKKMEAIELHKKMASEDVVLELIGELPELKQKAHNILTAVGKEHIKNMKLYRAGELVHEVKPNLQHEKKSYKKKPQK